MKTLIFNGSPRPQGDTVALLRRLTAQLPGACDIVHAYAANIAPCVDCRRCRSLPGCAIKDDMQGVYELIASCDNILLASPVYFEALTGRLLDVASRLQTFFCAKTYRGEAPIPKPKRGAILLVGGSNGGMEPALRSARIILRLMNCAEICPPLCVRNTDLHPAIEDEAALCGVDDIARFFAGGI